MAGPKKQVHIKPSESVPGQYEAYVDDTHSVDTDWAEEEGRTIDADQESWARIRRRDAQGNPINEARGRLGFPNYELEDTDYTFSDRAAVDSAMQDEEKYPHEGMEVHDWEEGTITHHPAKKNIKAIRLKYRKSLELRRQKSLQIARKALEYIQTKAIRRGTRVEIGPGVLAGSEGRATGRTQWQSWHENADGTWGRAADEIDVSTGPKTTWQDGFLPEEYTVVEQSEGEKAMRRGQRAQISTDHPTHAGQQGVGTGRTYFAPELSNADGTRGRSRDVIAIEPYGEPLGFEPSEYEIIESDKAFDVGDQVRSTLYGTTGQITERVGNDKDPQRFRVHWHPDLVQSAFEYGLEDLERIEQPQEEQKAFNVGDRVRHREVPGSVGTVRAFSASHPMSFSSGVRQGEMKEPTRYDVLWDGDRHESLGHHYEELELIQQPQEDQKAFNVGDRVRTVAGSLPGTVQSVQHNHPNFTNPDGTHQSVAEVTWDDLPNMPTYHPIHFLESDK